MKIAIINKKDIFTEAKVSIFRNTKEAKLSGQALNQATYSFYVDKFFEFTDVIQASFEPKGKPELAYPRHVENFTGKVLVFDPNSILNDVWGE